MRVKGQIDTSRMLLVDKRMPMPAWGPNCWREMYLARITENDDRVTRHYVTATYARHWNADYSMQDKDKSIEYSRHSSTQQKFLCIGGPYAGKKMALMGKDAELYQDFNNTSNQWQKDKAYRVISVFKGLLG